MSKAKNSAKQLLISRIFLPIFFYIFLLNSLGKSWSWNFFSWKKCKVRIQGSTCLRNNQSRGELPALRPTLLRQIEIKILTYFWRDLEMCCVDWWQFCRYNVAYLAYWDPQSWIPNHELVLLLWLVCNRCSICALSPNNYGWLLNSKSPVAE